MAQFIVFEGPDGSGKSTQIRLLYTYLRDKLKKMVVETREPGGTEIGQEIREILLNPNNVEMRDITEVLLYASSRAQHVGQLIKPSLEAGKTVLCDRFVDSSIAYQGYGRGIDLNLVKEINRFAMQGIKPDLGIYIMVRPEIALQRIAKKRNLDRLEKETIDFHQRLYEGYQKLIEEADYKHWINGEESIEKIHHNVKRLVKKHI